MHDAAREWVQRCIAENTERRHVVVEIGSLDVNGSVRDLFPGTDYTGIDLLAGPGVDVVGDVVDYSHSTPVDLVLCLEVLEHSDHPAEVCKSAGRLLDREGSDPLGRNGALILTAAGPGRPPHAADGTDQGPHPGEWYRNISEDDLNTYLDEAGFVFWTIEILGEDIRAVAAK
jgi:hypothetical protein